MINFADVKGIIIPEGTVKKITSGGVTLWEKISSIVYTASDFVLGSFNASNGLEYAVDNRVRTAFIELADGEVLSVKCSSGAKWLAHFYESGTWISRAAFRTTDCDDVRTLCTDPSRVTQVRIALAYSDDRTVTSISDLVGMFEIVKQL